MLYYDPNQPRMGEPCRYEDCNVYNTVYGFSTITPRDRERGLIKKYAAAVGLALLLYYLTRTSTSYLIAAMGRPYLYYSAGSGQSSLLAENILRFLELFSYCISFLLPAMGLIAMVKIPLRVALPARRFSPSNALLFLPVALAVSAVGVWLSPLITLLLQGMGFRAALPGLTLPSDPVGIVLFLLSSVLAPAFVEEVVFRGAIMQPLRRFGDGFALVVSSVLFGVLHLYPQKIPMAFLMGLVLGFAVLRTGSLWASVLIHLANNALAALMSALELWLPQETMQTVLCFLYGGYLVVGVLCFAWLLHRRPGLLQLREADCLLPAGERAKAFFTTAPVVILLVLLLWRIGTSL